MASFYMPSGGYVGSSPVGSSPSASTAAANAAAVDAAAAPVNNLRTQLFSNLGGALRGELPQDVIDQIGQHAAEFGVASGMPGSEFAQYGGLRTLGLNSLSRMQHAEDSLLPHFFQNSPSYQTVQQGGNMNVNRPMDPAFRGTNSAPLARGPSSGGERANPETGVKTPDSNSLVGDFLAKYLPGGRGGGVSTGMAPMGSGTQPEYNYAGAIPFFGSGVTASNAHPSTAPGFFAGSQDQFNNLSLEELADMGLIDPAFGVPDQQDYAGSFTGDIGGYGDYGDFGDFGDFGDEYYG